MLLLVTHRTLLTRCRLRKRENLPRRRRLKLPQAAEPTRALRAAGASSRPAPCARCRRRVLPGGSRDALGAVGLRAPWEAGAGPLLVLHWSVASVGRGGWIDVSIFLFFPGALLFGCRGAACAGQEVGTAVVGVCPWNPFRMIRRPYIHLFQESKQMKRELRHHSAAGFFLFFLFIQRTKCYHTVLA